MTRHFLIGRIGLLASAALLAGCSGGDKFAPVSGVVSLDGVPYSKAVVSFQPQASDGNPNPGRGSSAYTDENGRFVLKGLDGEDGAIVGKHRVRIMTRGSDVVGQLPEGESSPDGPVKNRTVDPIPPEWNALSTKDFDVPKGGTEAANFDIATRKGRKK